MEKPPSNESSESYFAEDLKFLSRFKDTDIIRGLTYHVPSTLGISLDLSSSDEFESDNYVLDDFTVKELRKMIQECKDGANIERVGYPYTFVDPKNPDEVHETELGILYPQRPDGTR
jgi:hypothetical protein